MTSFMFADNEPDTGSPTGGSRSERSSSISTENTSPSSPDGSERQTRRGHYRGITFDDILPPHLMANAPPPGAEQKRSSPAERRQSAAPTSSPIDATTLEARPSTKRNYPSAKKATGGKFRLRATARALARSLSMVKRDSRGRGGGYEAV